jgi:hypothetical protein
MEGKMKLTSSAFEILCQRCDPESRKPFFKHLAAYTPPFTAAGYIEVPAPKIERLLTGYTNTQVRLIAVADGAWDVKDAASSPIDFQGRGKSPGWPPADVV